MYDAACLSNPFAPLQRATGELSVSARVRDATTVLDGLRQAGCLKARFPRRLTAEWMDVVMLNTSGGVVGGDRLDNRFEVQAGARMSVAAQAAERVLSVCAGWRAVACADADQRGRGRGSGVVAAGDDPV